MKRLLFMFVVFLLGVNMVTYLLAPDSFTYQGLDSVLTTLSTLDIDFSNILNSFDELRRIIDNFKASASGGILDVLFNIFDLLIAPIKFLFAFFRDVFDFFNSIFVLLDRLFAYKI